MEVIDFIDLTVIDPEHVTKAVMDYIQSRSDIINSLDVQIRVSICKSQQSIRAGRIERTSTLAQLVELHGKSMWEQPPYKFNFKDGQYWVDNGDTGKYLHITAGEAVALYHKLVRKQSNDDWPSFYANMKKRHGAEFLKGYV
jgi:hypothetical protein